ncbi:putative transglutaminase-like cysteine proteinase [Nitrobacteraceae bacterium AZCC 2161]
MWIFERAHVWRAIGLACILVVFGPSAHPMAAVLQPSETVDAAGPFAEPFGLLTTAVVDGELSEKWRGVERELDGEALAIALCNEDRARCASPAALQFLDIVDTGKARDGRARLGEINRALNLAVRPGSDLALYGAIDVWRTPLALLAAGAGDCEDYAIAKFVALRLAGVASADLRIVILRDTLRHEDHAVAAARLDGRWFMLDNRRMAMVEDINLQNYRPLFVIDHGGVRQYFDQPLMAGDPRPVAGAAALMKLASRAN